jgi:hypothetical protein
MGKFYFTQAQPQPSTPPATAEQNTAIESSYEILFWESIKDSRDPRMFEAYLESYPIGIFVTLAQIHIQKHDQTTSSSVPETNPDSAFETVPLPKNEAIAPKKIPVENDKQIAEKYSRFIKYENGIVYDTQTGLEWVQGPDRAMGGFAAQKWAQQLELDGGGWEISKLSELQSLFNDETEVLASLPFLERTGIYLLLYGGSHCIRLENLTFSFSTYSSVCSYPSNRFLAVRPKNRGL